MKVKIIADSGCDLNETMKKEMDIPLVPLTIRIGEKTFKDDKNLNVQEFIEYMNNSNSAPQSASPSPFDFVEEYKGEEESVFVVTLSSGISSTYNNALLAQNMFLEKYGNKFIHVFDSLSASVGETLVCLKLFEMIKNHYANHEIVEKVNEYIREMKTFFLLESLDNLIKSGRLNKIAGKIASALSIKPIMGASEEGTIKLIEKTRGSKKALNRLIEIIGEQGERLEDKILGIAHCNCLKKAEKIRDEVKARYNFKDIIIVETGGLISTYANQDGIVIAF